MENPCLNMASNAQEALDKSDVVLLRCYENDVPLPLEWAEYRAELRTFLAGDKPAPLPIMPEYP
jgi:hypothetical protein